MIKKIVQYIELSNVGLLELIFSAYIILCGYKMPISSSVLVVLIMNILAIQRKHLYQNSLTKPIWILAIFIVVHDLLFIHFAPEVPNGFLNGLIANIVLLCSVPWILSAIDIEKLKGSINWIAIISVLGMLYHSVEIFSGRNPQVLTIPFFPFPIGHDNYATELFRPTSFYVEPQAFVSFILIPLFISLRDKKYIWSAILALSLLISTSTTGIFTTFGMIAIYAISQKVGKKNMFLVCVFGFLLYYIFISAGIFSLGIDKLENTDFATSVRVAQGKDIVGTMDISEFILGAPYLNSAQYCTHRGLSTLIEGDIAFMSTFWYLLLRFGVVGLVLYVMPFFNASAQNKTVIPYTAIYFITMFSNPDAIGGFYVFAVICTLALAKPENKFEK